MFDQLNFQRLADLEVYEPGILKEFSELLNFKQLAAKLGAHKLKSLKIESVDPYTIDATYVNTTVRFKLLIVYIESKPRGRIACMRKNPFYDEEKYDYLGGIEINSTGETSLPPYGNGEIRTMAGAAAQVVIGYMDKAILEPHADLKPK